MLKYNHPEEFAENEKFYYNQIIDSNNEIRENDDNSDKNNKNTVNDNDCNLNSFVYIYNEEGVKYQQKSFYPNQSKSNLRTKIIPTLRFRNQSRA